MRLTGYRTGWCHRRTGQFSRWGMGAWTIFAQKYFHSCRKNSSCRSPHNGKNPDFGHCTLSRYMESFMFF